MFHLTEKVEKCLFYSFIPVAFCLSDSHVLCCIVEEVGEHYDFPFLDAVSHSYVVIVTYSCCSELPGIIFSLIAKDFQNQQSSVLASKTRRLLSM